MDLLIALLPSLAFGSLGLILGAWPTDFRQQMVAVNLGAGAASLLLSLLLGAHWSGAAVLLGILSGLFWTAGQAFMLHGYQVWGVSRTVPFNTAVQLCLNALLGIFLFGEWHDYRALLLGFAALALINLGATGCSWQENVGEAATRAARRAGIIAATISAALFVCYPSALRLGGVSSADAVGPMGLGLLLGSLLMGLFYPSQAPRFSRLSFPSAVGGSIWAVGNVVLLRSTVAVGVAVGFTLSQLGFVLSTLGGIVLLHEVKTRRELAAALMGVLVAVVGVGLMGWASTF